MITFEEWIKKSRWEFKPPIKFLVKSPRFLIEYNTDTSAGHPVKDDDIVRYSEETQRVKDKEP